MKQPRNVGICKGLKGVRREEVRGRCDKGLSAAITNFIDNKCGMHGGMCLWLFLEVFFEEYSRGRIR